jgi:hypothetical protein
LVIRAEAYKIRAVKLEISPWGYYESKQLQGQS